MQAFYALLDELQEQGVSVVRQERTVLEADAYIAQMCLQDESIKVTWPRMAIPHNEMPNIQQTVAAVPSFSGTARVASPSCLTSSLGHVQAVVSTDSDFLVFNTPFLPLHSIDTRADGISPAFYVPRGRFAKVGPDNGLRGAYGTRIGLGAS